jgi:hypothetical protein
MILFAAKDSVFSRVERGDVAANHGAKRTPQAHLNRELPG